MTFTIADVVFAVASDTYDELETTEADGNLWIMRLDEHGDARTMVVSDSSLIIDTRDEDGTPVPRTEVVNITDPTITTAIAAARHLF